MLALPSAACCHPQRGAEEARGGEEGDSGVRSDGTLAGWAVQLNGQSGRVLLRG